MDLVTLLNLDREVESMFKKKPDEENRPPESEPAPAEPSPQDATAEAK